MLLSTKCIYPLYTDIMHPHMYTKYTSYIVLFLFIVSFRFLLANNYMYTVNNNLLFQHSLIGYIGSFVFPYISIFVHIVTIQI